MVIEQIYPEDKSKLLNFELIYGLFLTAIT